MSNKTEIRLTGSGGQGLIMAGIVLAEAAISEGFYAVQTQSYGPEARGGSSKAEVIISRNEIDFPKVDRPDIILALTQDAVNQYGNSVKSDGIVILDSSLTVPEGIEARNILLVPILETAAVTLKKVIVSNILALGFIVEYTGILGTQAIERAVLDRVPKGAASLNLEALHQGTALAVRYRT